VIQGNLSDARALGIAVKANTPLSPAQRPVSSYTSFSACHAISPNILQVVVQTDAGM
jgi:hypothetical protein